MAARDRTLLAKLGFADPDKKNPKHDLMCAFLADPVNRKALCKQLGYAPSTNDPVLEQHLGKGTGQYQTTIGFLDVVYTAYRMRGLIDGAMRFAKTPKEVETLTKRYFEYQKALATVREEFRLKFCKDKPAWMGPEHLQGQEYLAWEAASKAVREDETLCVDNVEAKIVIEVKTGVDSLGDLIRQIKLYRTYYHSSRNLWVVAVLPGVLNPAEEDLLRQQDVRPVVLSSFDAWLIKQAEQQETASTAVSI